MKTDEGSELKNGISAIIPTYKGEKYIQRVLDSLKNQTLDYNLFEAIIVVNGPLDKTTEIIEDFKEKNPQINLILTKSEAGVSNARNLAIKLASRQYTTFIDDDDYFSSKYFEKLLEYAKPDRIVVTTFLDENQDTGEIQESYLSPPLLKTSGIISNPFSYMPDILVITMGKLIPTKNIKNTQFNSELKNGVDVSYYARLYAENSFEFYLIDKSEDAVYYRLWRDNSISRQPLSYDFNVTDRLKVIKDINIAFKKAKTQELKGFLQSLTGGQVVKINAYLKKYPDDLEKVLNDIESYNFEIFPYKYLNEDLNLLNRENNELVISYAFSPTNTTTSNMVGKRILSEKNNVSVICASLDNLNKDYSFNKIIEEFIVDKLVIQQEFETGWQSIKDFFQKGMEILETKNHYDKIYSRAQFAHSHFLAIEYKLKYPNTYWRAEFSDPLIYNLDKKESTPPIEDKDYISRINKELNLNLSINNSINYICEYLTFKLADEIVFTNENQKRLMESILETDVSNKATISPHPTLDKKYYYIKNCNYEIDDDKINLAYFGAIFGNRNLEGFINGLDNIKEEYKDNYRLHIFSSNRTLLEQLLSPDVFSKTTINPPVDFLDFLNLTTKMDVLLVEDSNISAFDINPFLPSKISDYKGSGKPVWAICQKNSIMDEMDIAYKSHLNDLESVIRVANKIIAKKDSYNEKKSIDYLQNRISHLSKKIDELIQVAESEFKKDRHYEQEIQSLTQELNELKNSNSWKLTENFRKIGKKFK